MSVRFGDGVVYLYSTVIKHRDTRLPLLCPAPLAVALPGGVRTSICLFISHKPTPQWNSCKYDEQKYSVLELMGRYT